MKKIKKILLVPIVSLFTYLFIAFICEPIWPEPNLFGIIIICTFMIGCAFVHTHFWWKIFFPSNCHPYQKLLEGNIGWWLRKQIGTYERRQQKKEELRKAIIWNKEYDRKQRELAQQKTVSVKQYYRRKPIRHTLINERSLN